MGQADKGGDRNASILLGRNYNPVVPVLPTAKGDLDKHHVCHQDLVDLLDGIIFRLVQVLGGGGGVQKPLDYGVNQCIIQRKLNYDCLNDQDISC